MKIISGQARGINLTAPRGFDVRPTAVRARKALFDSLGQFSGSTVLDLFSGSGSLGLEAASRGADRVVFIEENRKHCRFIEQNIQKLEKAGVSCEFQVINRNALLVNYTHISPEQVDYIFSDPPYQDSGELFTQLISSTEFKVFSPDTLLIWELPDNKGDRKPFMQTGFWQRQDIRSFGGLDFAYFKLKSSS